MPTMQTGSGREAGHGARSGDTKDAYVVPIAPPISFNWQDDRTFRAEEEVTNPLRACQTEAICFDTTQITSPANRSRCEPGAPSHTLAKGGHPPAIAFKPGQSEAAGAFFATEEFTPTLQAQNNGSTAVPAVQYGMQVRRLTPRECERLQGFRDDYTLIPFGKKPAADGPRYKALGNSMAVPVMRWIGEQIDFALWCEENL